MLDDEDELEALAKRLGVTPEELRLSDFWHEVGGEELDAVKRALREESEGLGEDLT